MTVRCENCWSLYNSNTTKSCPACSPDKKNINQLKSNLANETQKFIKQTIKVMKKEVNSKRASDVSKAERERGISIYDRL